MSETDDLNEPGDDYYAFLNVPRNASEEEICNAYRRLSRLYHPDKHIDQQRKKEAEILFSKTKKAYEALKDPHSRAIYDSLGTAGLNTQGWEVVQRTKTPSEIREEYERLAREKDDRKVQQQTNPKSSITMNINASELFNSYDSDRHFIDLRDLVGLPHVEISGMTITQSIEAPLTAKNTAMLSGNLSSQNGTGHGGISCCLRRVLSEKGWGEVEVGAGNGLNVTVKGFRNFSRGFFGNTAIMTYVTPNGVNFGFNSSLANQLDQHTVGYLTWKAGMQSGMTTMIIRDTNHSKITGSLHFGIPHSYASFSYLLKLPETESKFKLTGKAGTFGVLFEYGAIKKISQHSSLGATMVVGVPLGVTLRLKIFRASQTYSASILLCDEVLPAPLIYGTFIPIVGWLALQKLIVQPYLKQKKDAETQKQRDANRSKLKKNREEAHSAVELMRETVKRIVETEEAIKGVIILQALYGRLVSDSSAELNTESNDVIDVTIPLQCLVKDSKLLLQESSKSQLPGFYDPYPGEDKLLKVRYLFRAVSHQVTISDLQPLRLPKQSHRVDS